jgi:hypothetical protein
VKSTQPSFHEEAGEATGVAVIMTGIPVPVAGGEVTVGMNSGIFVTAIAEVVGIGPCTAGAQAERNIKPEMTRTFVRNTYRFIMHLHSLI